MYFYGEDPEIIKQTV